MQGRVFQAPWGVGQRGTGNCASPMLDLFLKVSTGNQSKSDRSLTIYLANKLSKADQKRPLRSSNTSLLIPPKFKKEKACTCSFSRNAHLEFATSGFACDIYSFLHLRKKHKQIPKPSPLKQLLCLSLLTHTSPMSLNTYFGKKLCFHPPPRPEIR